MSKRFYPIMGFLIFIIPFLGIPGSWRHYLVSSLGLIILVYSMWPTFSKILSVKPKSARRDGEIKKVEVEKTE